MPIRTDYVVTDGAPDGLADVTFSKDYSAEQDADVVTLNQYGAEISLTVEMMKDVVEVFGKLFPMQVFR